MYRNIKQGPHIKPSRLTSCVHPTKLKTISVCRKQVLSTESHLLSHHRNGHSMSLHIIPSDDFCAYFIYVWPTPGQSEWNPWPMHASWCVDTHSKLNSFINTFRSITTNINCLWLNKNSVGDCTGKGMQNTRSFYCNMAIKMANFPCFCLPMGLGLLSTKGPISGLQDQVSRPCTIS